MLILNSPRADSSDLRVWRLPRHHDHGVLVLRLRIRNDVRLAESEYGYGNYYQYSSYREKPEAEEPMKSLK